MMPHFDSTISMGTIIQLVAIVGAGVVFFVRLAEIQKRQIELIETLREDLHEHKMEFRDHQSKDDTRFDRLEQRIIDLVAGLQRVIGQTEVFRHTPRQGNS